MSETEYGFLPGQWYKPSITTSNDPFVLSPIKGYITKNDDPEYKVNYIRYGIHSFLPQFCSIIRFLEMIDVNRPLTNEQAKEMHDFIYEQVKKSRYKSVIECKFCGWHSKILSRKEVADLGVPWYCDDCGRQATYIHDGTEEELENLIKERDSHVSRKNQNSI
jgi:hypothetical protein